jgi:hypothetical protein
MKHTPAVLGVLFLLLGTGCVSIGGDAGPTSTSNEEIDAGNAESVQTDIRMGGGDLHLSGGAAKLMSSSFRYSESAGRPTVRYDVTGSRGRLTVESPNSSSIGKKVNDWTLRMGSRLPLEMKVNMGGGDADLDMSKLPLQSVEVHMGAGDLKLNVSGKYTTDVTVKVSGGAGDARIQLPKDMGAVVTASIGVGSVNVKGLTKRDGKYYNAAYADGKPAVRMDVRGAVGDIDLNAE